MIPEIFLILFFQRGRPRVAEIFAISPSPSRSGDLMDRWSIFSIARKRIGSAMSPRFPVVLGKICIDQFGYNVFFAAPFGVLTYEWKNNGISLKPVRDLFTWRHYRDKIIPTLLATWAVWIPLMAIIYSLPLALQFPLFALALSFWVLLLTLHDEPVRRKSRSRRAASIGLAEGNGGRFQRPNALADCGIWFRRSSRRSAKSAD